MWHAPSMTDGASDMTGPSGRKHRRVPEERGAAAGPLYPPHPPLAHLEISFALPASLPFKHKTKQKKKKIEEGKKERSSCGSSISRVPTAQDSDVALRPQLGRSRPVGWLGKLRL